MAILVLVGLTSVVGGAEAQGSPRTTLHGVVESAGAPLAGYQVDLYASGANGKPFQGLLGTDSTDGAGRFEIAYRLPPGLPERLAPVLYVLAEKDASMLASAVGVGSSNGAVVINERTTVAIGAAFAQFIDGRDISGNTWGVRNAVQMAANLADPETGRVGAVLDNSPNADETSTRKTFNSLANIVASCVASSANCDTLFEHTTPPGGPAPTTVLQAVANTTRYPSNDVGDLFGLSFENRVYEPALTPLEEPTSWLLFIKFTGGFYSAYADTNLMSGPGNVAFDERGFAWINDNYVPVADMQVACAGLRLMKFHPWGESFPGSPYFGGGLSGAGFGITLDPRGRIWVGNFGFEAPVCDGAVPPDPASKIPATHDSLSLFRPDGTPISDGAGITEGHIWWPQATVSDRQGNIWAANCGNDTVTVIPRGNPRRARNVALPGGQGAMGNFVLPPGEPMIKPFAIAIDPEGRAWVTGNRTGWSGVKGDPAGLVYRIDPDGTVTTLPNPVGPDSRPLLSWPMGISGDSQGNMWVSNSDSVNVPCVTPFDPQNAEHPSIAFYPADGGLPARHEGGGLTVPWGNVVDGNDTLWVFNFGQSPLEAIEEDTTWPNTPVSHFCGADESKCPAGLKRGEAISPPKGYVTDALDRVTGGGIDPSGNLWLLNNWKKLGPYPPVYNTSPGGNSFVIVPGAAAPVKTPLIGPPVSFGG